MLMCEKNVSFDTKIVCLPISFGAKCISTTLSGKTTTPGDSKITLKEMLLSTSSSIFYFENMCVFIFNM